LGVGAAFDFERAEIFCLIRAAFASRARRAAVLNWISGTPGAAQAVVVFLFGTILAAAANYFVDRFGWTPRYRSP